MIVVDTNVLAAKNLSSEQPNLAEAVAQIDSTWIVPRLWRYEFQNILAKTIWAKQITQEEALKSWHRVFLRMCDNEKEPSADKVIELSAQHRITAYDATFVALAIEMGILLVTLDQELCDKLPGRALSMAEFIRLNSPPDEVRESRAEYRVRRQPKKQKKQHAALNRRG